MKKRLLKKGHRLMKQTRKLDNCRWLIVMQRITSRGMLNKIQTGLKPRMIKNRVYYNIELNSTPRLNQLLRTQNFMKKIKTVHPANRRLPKKQENVNSKKVKAKQPNYSPLCGNSMMRLNLSKESWINSFPYQKKSKTNKQTRMQTIKRYRGYRKQFPAWKT